jgi:putative protein-disulfide isomerase
MAVAQPAPLPEDVEFVYVGDPMCSWCWGFAPVLEAMTDHYAIPIRTVVGGLRPGPSADLLDDRMRTFLAHHWEQVAERSGQPFDHAALDRKDWVYDTELPARAVTTMREVQPDETLAFFTRLQRAFYAEVVDITALDSYPALLHDFPVDIDDFTQRLRSDQSKQAAWRDFAEARRLGITGFPSLLLRLGDEHLVVTRGYLPWDHLEPALSSWLRERYGASAIAGWFCDVGGC